MSLTKVTYSMIEGGVIYAKDYGVVGDGTTDDTAAWQAAAAAAEGKVLLAEPNQTYKMTGELALEDGTHFNLQNSTFNFQITGSVRCIVAGNNTVIENGSVKNFGTAAVAGDFQCPIIVGTYGTNVEVSNVIIRNMTIDSDWDQGNGIAVFSSSHDVLVENITVPDSDMFCPFLAHWSGTTAGTNHPYNIVVRNMTCGVLPDESYLVSVSAGYNITFENIYAERCGIPVHYYAGDYTNMYAPAEIEHLICTNVNFKNISCPYVTTANSASNGAIDCRGQSFNPNIVTPATQPLKMRGVISECDFWGIAGVLGRGVYLEFVDGIKIEESYIRDFVYGVTTGQNAYNVFIKDNHFEGINQAAMYISNSVSTNSEPHSWLIEGNTFIANNTDDGTTGGYANIYLNDCNDITVKDNVFGILGQVETTRYAIYVTSGALQPKIYGNHVRNLANTNTAYVIGAATDYDINAQGNFNTVATLNSAGQPITSFFGAPIFSNLNGIRSGIASEGTKPTTGTWNAGDKLYLNTPTSTILGWVCTTAGTGSTTSGGTAVWRDITA